MSKFEYSRSAYVTERDAKRARFAVVGLRVLGWLVIVAAYTALIVLTPSWIWITVTVVVVVFGGLMFLDEHGSDIAAWWRKQKNTYESARKYGVKDE